MAPAILTLFKTIGISLLSSIPMLNNQVDKTKNFLVLPVVKIVGQEKEFHEAKAVRIITVKVVAFTIGKATLKKNGKLPTPSIIAASLV